MTDDSIPISSIGKNGRLAENLMYFARTLRMAGLPIGPGKILDALRAIEAVGLERRDDFYWTLYAIFVNRHEQEAIFHQAFYIFWRNPKLLDRMMSMLLPTMVVPDNKKDQKINRRLSDVLIPDTGKNSKTRKSEEKIEFDAALTWSDKELLYRMDFEQMSAQENLEAKAVIKKFQLPLSDIRTRRFQRHSSGNQIDMRATLKASIRSGSNTIPFVNRRHRKRPLSVIILCDISGSMSRYSRMLLHFVHAISNHRSDIHVFVFGTRLTNITRHLEASDVDIALSQVTEGVKDWHGGTRISCCLHDFNQQWSRRVGIQSAVLLLISDGLDRSKDSRLAHEMERLHKSARHLIWLNPLLRYEKFQPKALGIRAILPHVDDFRPVHNLKSFAQLIQALSDKTLRISGSLGKAKEQLVD